MITEQFKRSAFHKWFGLWTEAEALSHELQELLNQRLQSAKDTVLETEQILSELRTQGHRLTLSKADSDSDLQVWIDGAFAVCFWADSAPKDVTRKIDRIEVLWQKM